MNEGAKTGIFWAIAVVMLLIAMLVAWPTSYDDEGKEWAGTPLFEKFTDPLAASSMKIVTFDEEQGQLATFEVRRDRETQLWTIPSRDGYPADAMEQMKDAANSLVALKILDIQTSNAEDHDDLGVAEPKLEDLEVGDEGVGRLVSLKNDSQETLASLIIGDAVKDDPEKRYVRIPSQDPVYVVKLDEAPLTTKFQDWIEDDLLQLSSIDIADMEIKDYTSSLGIGGQVSWTRNYTANVDLDGSEWSLAKLVEHDPKNPAAEPKPIEVGPDEKLNKTKLDAIKNALDDLKIADVLRKPEGMSANLRANQDLLSDNDAVSSLAQRGFFPVPSGPQGEVEILSANGELSVTLKDGVKYVMRFGNIAGVSDKDEGDAGEEVEAGVNRYLLVTTMVDQSKFPPPELKPVPQTLEELEAILNPKKEEPPIEINPINEPDTSEPKPEEKQPPAKKDDAESSESKSAESTSDEAKETATKEAAAESAAEPTGESESSGGGETSGTGQGQDPTSEDSAESQDKEKEAAEDADKPGDDKPGANKPGDDKPATDEPAETKQAETAETADAKPAEVPAADAKPADDVLTDEEKQERLEAEQEKITKENQRKLDERKDKLEAAEGRVRALNARFADWYYVIPEDTYSKLRIKRDELFEKPESEAGPAMPPLDGPPQFNFGVPGLPGAPPGN